VTVHHASPSIEPLPLVMDEVLVNFDPDRARRTAELIADVAQRNQVLLFTCHPETLALFRQVDPEIAVVGLDNGVIHGVERTGG